MEGKILYLIAIFLGIALIIFAMTSINKNKVPNNNLENTIKIQGESKLTIMPNESYIYFTIESKDLNAIISKNNVDDTWKEIKAKLDSEKIKYETNNYSVQPNYVWNEITKKSELEGYITRHSLIITLTDLNKVNSTIDNIVINNYTNIDSVAFGLSDSEESKLKAQLWSLAIKDAQTTVKEISKENGLNINQNPISIQEFGNYYRPYYSIAYDSVSSMDLKAEIAPKEQDASLTLELTFELE